MGVVKSVSRWSPKPKFGVQVLAPVLYRQKVVAMKIVQKVQVQVSPAVIPKGPHPETKYAAVDPLKVIKQGAQQVLLGILYLIVHPSSLFREGTHLGWTELSPQMILDS